MDGGETAFSGANDVLAPLPPEEMRLACDRKPSDGSSLTNMNGTSHSITSDKSANNNADRSAVALRESSGNAATPQNYSQVWRRRRSTSASLASFTSDHSDPKKVIQVGNLQFLNDSDMTNGQSPILGKGTFAQVRLARRFTQQRNDSMISDISTHDKDCSLPTNSKDKKYVLVAVKIFEKSLLANFKSIERDDNDQIQVHTALDNVAREIAVMKMIQHPNLVSLYDVIDTGSNKLYMVLEYLPLGQIMTNVSGTGKYVRRPAKPGEPKLKGVTQEGHFDEHHAALYFVDIMHALAHLHTNHIVHRDLKPENILLDARGHAKIGDFGVCHMFEDEVKQSESPPSPSQTDRDDEEMTSTLKVRRDYDAATMMKSMSSSGRLSKTEGTWAFWSPEMCAENSLLFSGYACDMWAAGICLYIFATGKLPIYSEIPLVLFDMIADADIDFDNMKLSKDLVNILKQILTKDPAVRAGIGDCINHPFCSNARAERTQQLGSEVEEHEEAIVQNQHIEQAVSLTKKVSLRRRFLKTVSSIMTADESQGTTELSRTIEATDTGKKQDSKKLAHRGSSALSFLRSKKELQANADEDGKPRRSRLCLPIIRRNQKSNNK